MSPRVVSQVTQVWPSTIASSGIQENKSTHPSPLLPGHGASVCPCRALLLFCKLQPWPSAGCVSSHLVIAAAVAEPYRVSPGRSGGGWGGDRLIVRRPASRAMLTDLAKRNGKQHRQRSRRGAGSRRCCAERSLVLRRNSVRWQYCTKKEEMVFQESNIQWLLSRLISSWPDTQTAGCGTVAFGRRGFACKETQP